MFLSSQSVPPADLLPPHFEEILLMQRDLDSLKAQHQRVLLTLRSQRDQALLKSSSLQEQTRVLKDQSEKLAVALQTERAQKQNLLRHLSHTQNKHVRAESLSGHEQARLSQLTQHYEQQLFAFQAQAQRNKSIFAASEKELMSLYSEYEQVSKERSQLLAQNQQLKILNQRSVEECRSLREELLGTRKIRQQQELELKETSQKIRQQSDLRHDQDHQMKGLRLQNFRLKNEINKAERDRTVMASLESKVRSIEECQKETQGIFEGQIKELQDKVQALKTQNLLKLQELQNCHFAIQRQQAKADKLINDNQQLSEQKVQLQLDIQRLNQQLEVAKLNDHFFKLQTRKNIFTLKEGAEYGIDLLLKEKSSLAQENRELKGRIAVLQAGKSASLQDFKIKIQDSWNFQNSQIISIAKERDELARALKDAEHEACQSKARIALLMKQLDDLRYENQVIRLQVPLGIMRTQSAGESAELKELGRCLQQQQNQNRGLMRQLQRLREREKQYQGHMGQFCRWREQVENLSKRL